MKTFTQFLSESIQIKRNPNDGDIIITKDDFTVTIDSEAFERLEALPKNAKMNFKDKNRYVWQVVYMPGDVFRFESVGLHKNGRHVSVYRKQILGA